MRGGVSYSVNGRQGLTGGRCGRHNAARIDSDRAAASIDVFTAIDRLKTSHVAQRASKASPGMVQPALGASNWHYTAS